MSGDGGDHWPDPAMAAVETKEVVAVAALVVAPTGARLDAHGSVWATENPKAVGRFPHQVVGFAAEE